MLDSLFGAEMPLAVRFFLAFLIVLGLIGATAWAVRRFGTGRLGGASRAGRQPRLAVIDYASVDGRRRLILVRRDNVEHLMMIGGPTDVVVEANIVRAQAAPRELPTARPTAGIDALARAVPLPEPGNGGSWPLAPEPAPRPRAEPLAEELPRQSQPHAEPRPQRDTLAALADELSAPRPTIPPLPPRRPIPPRPAAAEEPYLEPKSEAKSETKTEPKSERKAPPPAAPSPAAAPAEADQSLADMAQRLEAALRKPEARPAAALRGAPEQAAHGEPPPPPPRPARPGEPKPARPEGKKPTLYDNLEQEMASLLGRPTKP